MVTENFTYTLVYIDR